MHLCFITKTNLGLDRLSKTGDGKVVDVNVAHYVQHEEKVKSPH